MPRNHDPEHGEPPSERDIRPGDLALDTAQGGAFVQVLRKEADSVRAYMDSPAGRELDKHLLDYPGNWMTGGHEDAAVWKVLYIPSNVKSFPSKSNVFDFPETRLARVPAEVARQDLMRVQRVIAAQTLASALRAFFGTTSSREDLDEFGQQAEREGIDLDTFQAAVELAFPNLHNDEDEPSNDD